MGFLHGDPGSGYCAEGCASAKSCLDCPLERCIEDVPGFGRLDRRAESDARIWARRRAGKGSREIAAELGLSRRTIQRSLARERRANQGGVRT